MFYKSKRTKPEIRLELGDKAKKVLYYLDQEKPDFDKSSESIVNYVMKYPRDREKLIEYRNITNQIVDPFMPENPYFAADINSMYFLEQQDIEFAENSWQHQWEEERKARYENSKNMVYNRDYTKDFLRCAKYPIVGNVSRKMFLMKLDQDLQHSKSWKSPEIHEKTHMQTMYAQADNGKLYRFMYVIKIAKTTEDSGTMTQIPTFDFSVTIKVMPDDDLSHATTILRFDSQKSGHTNILGHETDESTDSESCSRFLRERLYKLDSNLGPHMHVFDRNDQIVYCGRPLSSNAVTITQLINIGKKKFKDSSAFNGLVELFVNSPEKVDMLERLRDLFRLSHNRLDGKDFEKRKLAWHDQLTALRQTLKIIDNALNVYPEKSLEEGREIMLGNGYADYEKMQMEYDLKHGNKNNFDEIEIERE